MEVEELVSPYTMWGQGLLGAKAAVQPHVLAIFNDPSEPATPPKHSGHASRAGIPVCAQPDGQI